MWYTAFSMFAYYVSTAIVIALVTVIHAYFYLKFRSKETKYKKEIGKLEKEVDEAKEDGDGFVSMASFQLRAELTSVKGYASMLLQGDYGPLDGKLHEPMEAIYVSSANLVEAVDNYIDMLRLELGKMKYEFMPLSLRKLIDGITKELGPNLESKGLSFMFSPGDQSDDYVMNGDAGKIRQVIGNLIDNAIKYTDAGSISVTLERKNNALGNDPRVRITVADTGLGFDKEVGTKLFRRFSRTEQAKKANIMGSGLGLYIIKQLVDAHGGKVWAESEGEGKGSRFHVELPANKR